MRKDSETRSAFGDPATQGGASAKVDACVQQRIECCPYAFYFNRVKWQYDRGTLTLEGRVPTFYMKQILQTILLDIDDVQQIANRVDVVRSTGLSSELDK